MTTTHRANTQEQTTRHTVDKITTRAPRQNNGQEQPRAGVVCENLKENGQQKKYEKTRKKYIKTLDEYEKTRII